jgi:hypothetical protein
LRSDDNDEREKRVDQERWKVTLLPEEERVDKSGIVEVSKVEVEETTI